MPSEPNFLIWKSCVDDVRRGHILKLNIFHWKIVKSRIFPNCLFLSHLIDSTFNHVFFFIASISLIFSIFATNLLFLTSTQTHSHAHPPLPGSLLLWSVTYDDAGPTWDVLPLIYYLCSILSLKLCSWSVTLLWHFCIAKIPPSFFSEILLHSQLVPYSLTHHCSPTLAPAGLIEDASALLESELSRKLWNQMFLTFTGRRDSPDYMQWVKGSSKLATNVISHLERSRQPLSWKRTRVRAAETPNEVMLEPFLNQLADYLSSFSLILHLTFSCNKQCFLATAHSLTYLWSGDAN